MKIVIVNNLFPPFSRGGAEKVVATTAQAFESLGHQVFIITTKPYFHTLSEKQPGVIYVNSLYYHLGRLPKFLRLIWHGFNIQSNCVAKKISQLNKSSSVDLVITNNLQGLGLSIGKTTKKLKLGWIHILHDIQLLHPSGLLTYQKENEINSTAARQYQQNVINKLGDPDLVVSPSNWLLKLHRDYGYFKNSRLMIIPNPSNLNARLNRKEPEKCRFLFVGQVEEHKGVFLLIEAFKIFSSFNQEAELVIVGEGKSLPQAIKLAKDYQITFTGKVTNEMVSKIMSESSCLVMSSLCYENYPTVINEAIQANLPVIGSNLGGLIEMIGRQEYLFIPQANKLADKLNWVATNRRVLNPPSIEQIDGINYASRLITSYK